MKLTTLFTFQFQGAWLWEPSAVDSGHQARRRILTRAHALFQEAYARAADSTMPAGYNPKPKLQFQAWTNPCSSAITGGILFSSFSSAAPQWGGAVRGPPRHSVPQRFDAIMILVSTYIAWVRMRSSFLLANIRSSVSSTVIPGLRKVQQALFVTVLPTACRTRNFHAQPEAMIRVDVEVHPQSSSSSSLPLPFIFFKCPKSGTFDPMSLKHILNAKSTAFTPEHSCREWLYFWQAVQYRLQHLPVSNPCVFVILFPFSVSLNKGLSLVG